MRIHKDPHVVGPRPPRVPKSSPIVDSSNTRPLTTERRSRSERVSTKAHVAPRCASTANSHFLSEFNVDNCFDFRSIPDPPSPEPRCRRRLSSPMLSKMSQPYDHRSQGSTSGDLCLSNSEAMPKGAGKRSRKSLCHVPSPVVSDQHGSPSLSDSPAQPARKVLQVNICLDDDDANSNKRRKKRQSMDLPREWVREHVDLAESSFQPPRAAISLGSFQSDGQRAFAGDMQNMKDLQALVRGYCKVPKEDRGKSEEASNIEQHTGYPLVAPESSEGPLSLANRRSVLQKMAPIIEEIDKRKAEDIAKWEQETKCRVERSSKSGRYRYISIETNAKISSQEYKRRYMDVLKREASMRLTRTEQWKDKLSDSKPPEAENEAELTPEDMEPLAYDAPLVTDSSSDMEDNENRYTTTQELDLDLNKILALDTRPSQEAELESCPPKSQDNEGTSMDICDDSVSMDLGEQSDVRLQFEPTELPLSKSSPQDRQSDKTDADDLIEEHSIRAPTPTYCQKPSMTMVPKSVSPTEMEVLPLPDRYEESSDPEIAKSERKLWSRIDAALQDYSQEVMKIMESKRPGVSVPVS